MFDSGVATRQSRNGPVRTGRVLSRILEVSAAHVAVALGTGPDRGDRGG